MLDIVVTNRHLCKGNFLYTIKKSLIHKPFALLLREKDLPRDDYLALARQVNDLCTAHRVSLIPHTHPVPGIPRLQVPFHLATEELAAQFRLSISIHSVEETRISQDLGASFVIAGHIFETPCKAELPARGLDFLKNICEAVTIPVFAIGGITVDNAQSCIEAGAAGVCNMSYWMEESS